jgi:hypothetical protein
MKLRISMLLLLATSAHAGPAGCQSDQGYDPDANYVTGAPGPIKLFHVEGQIQCSSRANIGYWCAVSTRDATDCGSGHLRLKSMNCCHFFNGVKQEHPMNIGYVPGKCTPFY